MQDPVLRALLNAIPPEQLPSSFHPTQHPDNFHLVSEAFGHIRNYVTRSGAAEHSHVTPSNLVWTFANTRDSIQRLNQHLGRNSLLQDGSHFVGCFDLYRAYAESDCAQTPEHAAMLQEHAQRWLNIPRPNNGQLWNATLVAAAIAFLNHLALDAEMDTRVMFGQAHTALAGNQPYNNGRHLERVNLLVRTAVHDPSHDYLAHKDWLDDPLSQHQLWLQAGGTHDSNPTSHPHAAYANIQPYIEERRRREIQHDFATARFRSASPA